MRQRTEYEAEYATIGSMPGLIKDSFEHGDDDIVRKLLCDSLVLSRRGRETKVVDEYSRFVSALSLKLLQRGRMPLPTLEIERSAIRAFGLEEHTDDLSETDGGELGWEWESGKRYRIDRSKFVSRLSQRRRFELEAGFSEPLLDSPYELQFITRWVTRNLGEDAAHWITPQAPLDALIESSVNGQHGTATGRRVDFLVYLPGTDPFVIEIDGPEHQNALQVDQQRDYSLKRSTGMDVIRVTNQEITPGPSEKLDQIRGRLRCAAETTIHGPDTTGISNHERIAQFAMSCSIASKIQLVIARAVSRGWLSGDEWNLDISGAGPAVAGAVLDVLRMYSAYDLLYGGKSRPDRCNLRTDDGKVRAWLWEEKGWTEIEDAEFGAPYLSVLVEPDSSPFDELVRRDVDFIIRPAFLPAELRTAETAVGFDRTTIASETIDDALPALTFFLQNVFRKTQFRPGQAKAIWRTLRQEDTIVLLPTGAGKSLIYQLAGLLMPGMTIVIDPIISLMNDQIEGLLQLGVDRAQGLSSETQNRETVLRRAECNEFLFMMVAPERFQSAGFRESIRRLRQNSLTNLAVIDEAHCVSEWGHEFRPAYLRLAATLRDVCRDMNDNPPPLLALTGTASRAVLRDTLTQLEINDTNDCVVRPKSFDRSELSFEIRRVKTSQEGTKAIADVMQFLPEFFQEKSEVFFQPRDRKTSSGIVFVRTVGGRDAGLWPTRATVETATRTTDTEPNVRKTVFYHGTGGNRSTGMNREEFAKIKAENAAKFKHNKVPIMVATKAYGMGIDKPNVRYVVHNGMPGSIESYYQEAGRAGRDGNLARCVIVSAEFDDKNTEIMLQEGVDIEEMRRIHRSTKERDDASTAVYFHLESFQGITKERRVVGEVIRQIGDFERHGKHEVYWDGHDSKRLEFAVVRLIRIGAISDYEVDWNNKRFMVEVPEFDIQRCKDVLREYSRTAQPIQASLLARRIAEIPEGPPAKSILALATWLIKFTYDNQERSRRAAIREAMRLARTADDDANIRARILSYFNEDFHAKRFDQLLMMSDGNIDRWWELIQKVQSVVDAGELRGLSIRALESYPENPGLLFVRAASEAICSDRDDRVAFGTFSYAVQMAVKFEARGASIARMIENLYEFGHLRAPVLNPLLVMGLLNLEANAEVYRSFRTQAYEHARNSSQPETATIAAAFLVGDTVADATDLVGKWQNRFTPKSLQLLGLD